MCNVGKLTAYYGYIMGFITDYLNVIAHLRVVIYFFSVLHHIELNVFGFWNDNTRHLKTGKSPLLFVFTFLKCILCGGYEGMWVTLTLDIFHYFRIL